MVLQAQKPENAVHAAQDAVTVARNAPRGLASRQQLNAHPVEGADDPRIGLAHLLAGFSNETIYRRKISAIKDIKRTVRPSWIRGACSWRDLMAPPKA